MYEPSRRNERTAIEIHAIRLVRLLMAIVVLLAPTSAYAQGWTDVPIPAAPPAGLVWELQPVSDDFSYSSSGGNRPDEFTRRWNDTYINGFSGPSCTSWHRDHVWTDGQHLAVHANWDADRPVIYAGCISSVDTYSYPMLMEAKVKLTSAMLANDVWMISGDETEEIDLLEAYPNDRENLSWFDQRLHLSHHVFVRRPFQDYQPSDEQGVSGTWYFERDRKSWRGEWLRVAVFWRDPWHLEYFINGQLVRTVDRDSHSYRDETGAWVETKTEFNVIDKHDFTGGTGLSKSMHIVVNLEQQQWITERDIFPSREDLNDENHRNIMWVDWLRVYCAVEPDEAGK